ncbi:MAG: hypothetical protein A2600_12320 [Candidatus Lambdaproteobacteria bacterium RIFOXYD1_FULL_56_27]|uniref:CENP-V/GFA domain-containing protein n=1 Tax=Candidatus Lambdaproteobacteria bacterium RIFOXYD2_FULL_56_26 TaxID=1817773 RepID=A0A1F6GLH5_9PROT|nr:MAG: hypothetical protein A2557_02145 [Candidatus Lambdaproteobacteria bacterium RIFOXYD2_FULL_56_26]OGH02721.1 MAG: hypothetical protein A2426_07330 [Candidatus Lambdaproteobacteria bacterium RIFOXYC1_FULL_56_13]OGH08634.1 MAG: hypothetical protein A2600_12320 [Candidatus Lambdaproteobacteria bacterium RIFOXYD1_FULL_56_27]
MSHKGSCHCGAVAYQAEFETSSLIECNCSICTTRGHLLVPVPAPKFQLLTDPTVLSGYSYGKKVITHYFCPTCGIGVYSSSGDPTRSIMLNARTLEQFWELSTHWERKTYNGKDRHPEFNPKHQNQ